MVALVTSAAPPLRQREGVLDDALDARAREDRRLDADLAGMALVHATADARVLALGVLAHEQHVDVARRAAGQRARDALEQAHGPHVGPQVEPLTDRQEQAPERHVIGDIRSPDGAEQNGVERSQLLDRVGRHHRAVLEPMIRAPIELAPLEREIELIDAAARLGNHLWSHAVAGQERDAMRHGKRP